MRVGRDDDLEEERLLPAGQPVGHAVGTGTAAALPGITVAGKTKTRPRPATRET